MRDKKEHLWFLFQFLQEQEVEKEKQVMIENVVNLRLMCDYAVSCSYNDIVLIICMLRDYVKMLDGERDDIWWKSYYRQKFMEMADRFSGQIEYDYDVAVEKCRRKMKERQCDIGEDALVLTMK